MANDFEKTQEVKDGELNDNIENCNGLQTNPGPYYYADEEYVYKQVDICMPVSIKPYAEGGIPIITPIGTVRETYGHSPCEYGLDICTFTVCQKLCIKLPVKYTITTTYGEVCAKEDMTLDDSCN